MNAERWKQIDELVDEALELPEDGRAFFVTVRCGEDKDLKEQVLKLLAAQKDSDKFMQNSAMNLMAKAIADDDTTVFQNSLYNRTLGNYRIEKILGAGGMGEVYLAHDQKLDRKVALKILPKEFHADDERVKRFEIEARAIAVLNHPNIVTIYDFGHIENVNYIATEFVEGKTVRDIMGEKPPLKEILSIILQATDALSAAHNAGIIHRDIKPENIMVRPDGYIKILDFGLAKLTESEQQKSGTFDGTMKGAVIGTPAYMSPEQASGDFLDHRTDLWSIGLVLYEMITGKNPFKKDSRQATIQAVLTEEPPLISSFNAELPAELDQILVKALEKDADLSYQTASDFRADLKRVKREIDSSPSWSRSGGNNSLQILKKPRKHVHYLLFTFYFLLFTLSGFGIWYFFLKTDSTQTVEASDWANARHSQLTDSSSVEGYPSLSPDGKNIVFAGAYEANSDIFLLRVGGKNPVNLTSNSKEADTMPAFSPDGKYIAFRSERNPGGIYIMEETGENVRRVSDTGFHPAWSPDGKKIVVSDKVSSVHTNHTVPNSSLYVIDVATGNKEKLETKGDAIMPSWSPNGHRIAFWFVAEGKAGEIATIPAEGGEPAVIASDAAADWNPVWSPDGKYLYFASNRNGNMSVWRVSVDEKTGRQLSEPESVPTPSRYCRHITLSRSGNLLGYVRYESKSNLQSIAFNPQTLQLEGEANWITRGNNEIGNPQMSPDGENFVVRNPDNTKEDLIVFDKRGENWRNLTNDTFRERIPRWSPDGKRIAFHSDRSGKYQIWTINPDGSNAEQITFSEKTGANFAVFSPDGSRLIYTEIEGNLSKPFMLDLTRKWAEQTPAPLPPFPGFEHSFSPRDWSKDGKKLLVNFSAPDGDESGIGVFDFDTQTYEKLTEFGSTPFWLGDNRHFIFTSRNTILLGDMQTKKINELYKPAEYQLQHANISPDNKMIYFRYLQVDADVWLIDASPENQ